MNQLQGRKGKLCYHLQPIRRIAIWLCVALLGGRFWPSFAQSPASPPEATLAAPPICIGERWLWRGNEFSDAPAHWENSVTEVKAGIATVAQIPQSAPSQIPALGASSHAAVAKPRIQLRNAEGNTLQLGNVKYEPSNQELAWPLSIGKAWRIDHRYNADFGGIISKTGEAKVISLEWVNTPAGRFEAYRIQQYGQLNNSASRDWRARYQATYWYAPAAKGIVKYTYAHQATRGSDALREGELIAYKKPEHCP